MPIQEREPNPGARSKRLKATPEISTIQKLLDDAAHDGAPESVLAFVALIPDALEFVKVVLDQAIQR